MPRRTDIARFLPPEATESPTDRRARIQNAMQRSAAMAGAIKESAAENERMYKLHRLGKGEMALDMRDLLGGLGSLPPAELFPEDRHGMLPPGREMLTEEFPTNHDNMIMQEMYNRPVSRQQQSQQPRRQSLMETMPQKSKQVPQTKVPAGWIAKKYLGETRGGDTVSVWKVQNPKTGASVDKIFRLEAVAKRVASLLSESNNQYDPKVVSVIMDYDKRDKLLKESRLLEKDAAGKPMKTSRLNAIRAEIAALEYKLGV